MKAFVAVVASLAAAANGQVLLNGAYPGYVNAGVYAAPAAPAVLAAPALAAAPAVATASVAAVPAAPHAQQFHTQDEFGNLAFGYSNPNSARREEGNTWNGVRTGGWSYVDANGVLQHTEYVADGAGFRVKASNLPVAPVFAPGPLPVAPVDTGVAPAPVEDTPEVAAAKAEFAAAFEEAAAREKRSAQFIPAAPLAGPFGYAAPLAGGVVAAPATAGVPGARQTVKLTPGHAVFTRVYNLPGEAELINQA